MSPPDEKIAYHLNFSDVIRVLRLVDETPFQELQLELGDLKVRVVREQDGDLSLPPPVAGEGGVGSAAPEAAESAADRVPSAAPPVSRAVTKGTPVEAPLAGTFYRSPYPGEPPFVEVGTVVKEGDVVGILEIMKLMNHVKAPCSGVIREICAENEEFVEFGQVLAVIEPDKGPQ